VVRAGSLPSNVTTGTSTESWATYGYYNLGLTATQLLYDFGQTSGRWKAARATESAQRSSERTTMAQVVFTVRTVFFQARAAKGMVDVANETLSDQRKHLEQTEGFVEVGTQAPIALAQSKAGVANARVQLIVAENAYRTAKAQLNQAMGVEGPLDYDIADDAGPAVDGESGPVEKVLDEAIRARPELKVLQDQVHAQELTVRSIQGAYGPTVGVSTTLSDAGQQVGGLTWNWGAAVVLSVPIWPGGLTRAQVREAKATLASLHAQADIQRLQVRLDVEQALLAVRAAKESVGAAAEALASAREQLRLAEGRYETGVGSILELTDAQVAFTSAGQQKVQSDYSVAQARALLRKALGRD
jgi:outer membrane protein